MKFFDSIDAGWHRSAADGSALAPAAYSLLDLAQWARTGSTWPAELPVGLVLPNDVPVAQIAADLPRLALVVLDFPKWTDGRAYSQAHLLRARHQFTGEVRASGEVLVDMLPLLQRNGVDAVVLRSDQSVDAARRALVLAPAPYQGDAVEGRPRFARVAA